MNVTITNKRQLSIYEPIFTYFTKLFNIPDVAAATRTTAQEETHQGLSLYVSLLKVKRVQNFQGYLQREVGANRMHKRPALRAAQV